MITVCIWKPGTYSFFSRRSTFLSRPNTFQVIPGRLNALSDSLSCKHQLLMSDWTFHQEVTNSIFLTFGYPLGFLFATRDNHILHVRVQFTIQQRWRLSRCRPLETNWFLTPISLCLYLGVSRCALERSSWSPHWWPRRFWFNDLLSPLYDFSRKLTHRSYFLSQRDRFHKLQTCSTSSLAII
ncbi:hypothetical protein DPMN_107148 [Dreissena polymorpha]|uniref:Uncharacterized protein n=1 Tax=Dreissena polymorpha TaxID=45954 RepID=A0A9D4K6L6_DREPO|nr:hypothetical protein DPMN_107148 [Dreissena polymorpha]